MRGGGGGGGGGQGGQGRKREKGWGGVGEGNGEVPDAGLQLPNPAYRCLSDSKFPAIWKVSHVTPLAQKGAQGVL